MSIRRLCRLNIIGIPVYLVISISVLGCQSTREDNSSLNSREDVLAVQQTLESWFNNALAHLDTVAVANYLTPKFGSTEPVGWLDRHSFLEWITTFEKDFGGPFTMKYSLHDWHTKIHGDVAWTSLTNDGILTVEEKGPKYMRWAESGVLVRQSDGRWLIDQYHSTFLGFQKPDSLK